MTRMPHARAAAAMLLAGILACSLPGAPQAGEAPAATQSAVAGDAQPRSTAQEAAGGQAATQEVEIAPTRPVSGEVVQPGELAYLGAFRLPESEDRPRTFAYGGNGLTFNPNGDASGPDDGFPGSLFVTGHDRLPYGELPDGSQVAEVSIPSPAQSRAVASLPRAEFVQEFRDATAGHFTEMEEIVRIGLLYMENPATGPLIHIAWGQHIEPDPTEATHGWFNADLSNPDFQGPWFIAGQSWYSVNDYMFEIPAAWAEEFAGGRAVATGRFKDGGWSGMGPVIIAYRPWDENGNPPPAGTRLESTTLLRYAASTETEGIERCLTGYQHPDEWSGGVWLTTPSGKAAVLFAGAKSSGAKYWYGYANPAGPQFPCVDEEVTDFLTCRLADGSPCPPEDLDECSGHNDYRGWWTTQWDSQFILYDPADLARVAGGEMESWEPQPYAVVDIDDYLFFNPSGTEQDNLGAGDQRRYRIGDVAFDRGSGLLYVLELFADEAAPVVHVWRINS